MEVSNLLPILTFSVDTECIEITGISFDAGFLFDASAKIERKEFAKEYDILAYIVHNAQAGELLRIPLADLPEEEGVYTITIRLNNNTYKVYHTLVIHKLVRLIVEKAKSIDLDIEYDDQTSIKYNQRNYNLADTERILKAAAKLNGVVAAVMLNDFESAEELIEAIKNLMYD